MPFIDVADERIFYSFSSSDHNLTVLAIHGSGGDHTAWPEALRNLPGATVYAVDLPGHGRSSGKIRDNVAAYADFIDGFATELHLDNVTLIGHSLGGAISLMLAVRPPGWLTRIILVGTGARLRVHPDILDGLLSNFEAAIDIICQFAYGPTASEALISSGRESFLNTPANVIHGDLNVCNQFDIMEKVGEISLPTIVISGTADNLTPVKYGEYLCKHISGAKHTIIEDGGHMMALEKPKEFIRSASDFLAL
jgi:pimeloyl-ACP methyl ester carboxylesterase